MGRTKNSSYMTKQIKESKLPKKNVVGYLVHDDAPAFAGILKNIIT